MKLISRPRAIEEIAKRPLDLVKIRFVLGRQRIPRIERFSHCCLTPTLSGRRASTASARSAAAGSSTPECTTLPNYQIAASFEHDVGAQQKCLRNLETDCLRGLEVDHQFELCGLLDRKITYELDPAELTDLATRYDPAAREGLGLPPDCQNPLTSVDKRDNACDDGHLGSFQEALTG